MHRNYHLFSSAGFAFYRDSRPAKAQYTFLPLHRVLETGCRESWKFRTFNCFFQTTSRDFCSIFCCIKLEAPLFLWYGEHCMFIQLMLHSVIQYQSRKVNRQICIFKINSFILVSLHSPRFCVFWGFSSWMMMYGKDNDRKENDKRSAHACAISALTPLIVDFKRAATRRCRCCEKIDCILRKCTEPAQ